MANNEDFLIDTGSVSKDIQQDEIVYELTQFKESSEKSPNAAKKFQNARIPNRRYHEMNKFSHIKPGKLSKELLEAISCSKQEIPLFIYKMRSAGYPPGWLEEAKTTSDITFKEDVPKIDKFYERNSLIEWPGFNAKWKNSVDRFEQLCCRPISQHDYLDNFYSHIEKRELRRAKRDLDEHRKNILKEIEKVESSLNPSNDNNPVVIDVDQEDAIKSVKITDEASSFQNKEVDKNQDDKELPKEGETTEIVIDSDSKQKQVLDENPKCLEIIGIVSDTAGILPDETKLVDIFRQKIESSLPDKIASDNSIIKVPKLDNFSCNILPMQTYEAQEGSKQMYQNMIDLLRKRKRSLK